MKPAAKRPPEAARRPCPHIKSRLELAEIESSPKRGGHAFRKRRSFPGR